VCVCVSDREYPGAVNQAEGFTSQPSESPNLITQIFWDMILSHQASSQIFNRMRVLTYSCYHHTPLDSNIQEQCHEYLKSHAQIFNRMRVLTYSCYHHTPLDSNIQEQCHEYLKSHAQISLV